MKVRVSKQEKAWRAEQARLTEELVRALKAYRQFHERGFDVWKYKCNEGWEKALKS